MLRLPVHDASSRELLGQQHPLLLSLAGVGFLVVAVGLVALPRDWEGLVKPPYVSVTHCCVTNSGRRAMTVSWSIPPHFPDPTRYQIALHDLEDEQRQPSVHWPALKPISAVGVPGKSQVFVACWNREIYLIDVTRPNDPPELFGRDPQVVPDILVCSPDGETLLTASPGRLTAWNIPSKSVLWSRSQNNIRLAVHPDSRTALCGTGRHELSVLDMGSGKTLRRIVCDENVFSVQFNAQGTLAALVEERGRIRLVHWPSLAPAWEGDAELPRCAEGSFVAFSPAGDVLITAAADLSSLAIWSVSSGRLIATRPGHARLTIGAAFLDNHRFCSWGTDQVLRIWDLRNEAEVRAVSIAAVAEAI